jgi:outer membrane PBP1 activator LpoA protein
MSTILDSIAAALKAEAYTALEAALAGAVTRYPAQAVKIGEWSIDLAGTLVDNALSSTDDLKAQIDDWKEAIKEECAAVLIDIEATAKSVFMSIVDVIANTALGMLPLIGQLAKSGASAALGFL